MPAWLDQLLVLAAVLGAGAYFGVRLWRKRSQRTSEKPGAGCSGGCCPTQPGRPEFLPRR